MSIGILLVGRKHGVLETAQKKLDTTDVELSEATSAAEVEEAFRRSAFAHVFMGAGLELDERLAVVRAVYEASGKTTLHLKDVESGPEGFLPFVQAIMTALRKRDIVAAP